MAGGASQDGWSRLVGWLKVALPLTALALLSTLFLVSNRINPEDALPYAQVDVEDRLKEPRITMPAYAGTTTDGAALEVTAAEARPAGDANAGANAQGLRLHLTTPDGARTDLVAERAQMTLDQKEVAFLGSVRLDHSSGYSVMSDSMAARLDETDIRSTSPVVAEGPGGRITAQSMQLTQAGAGSGGYVLVFNGDVKLVYQPAE